MVRQQIDDMMTTVRREADDIASTIKDTAESVHNSFKGASLKEVGKRFNEPTGFNPVKVKKFLIVLIKILIVFEFMSATLEGFSTGNWGRLGHDLLLAGIIFIMWDRITHVVLQKKDEYRRKMEQSGTEIKLWDALVFSLLWSDEIYQDIPVELRRLVVIAYTLIAIGAGALYIGIGTGLVGLILCSSLILAAVNLLAWVVSRERGEKESLQTELRLAHDVQTGLMPKEHPDVNGFDIAGFSLPAKEVGGDHFDYAHLHDSPSKFAVCVFDVSGKGMQAAMSAVFTSGAFASEIGQSQCGGTILTRLNRSVYTHSRRGHFVAFLLAVLDSDERSLTFANAGQMKPLLKSGESVQQLDSAGVHFPLGMTADSQYEERTVYLQQGDVVLLYTDGISEAMNARHEEFGVQRLIGLLQKTDTRGIRAADIVNTINEDVRLHAGAVPQHDDMTMVVVKVL